MKQNKDYEQMYYDLLYENKKIVCKCKELEQELNVYKEMLKNKPIKKIITEELSKYLRRNK